MPLYDFRCPACGIFEAKARYSEEVIYCACGEPASRQSVYHVAFTGFTRTPVAERQVKLGAFQESSAELEHQHSRQTNVDGSLGPQPQLWREAKREAKRLEKLGVKDSLDLRKE